MQGPRHPVPPGLSWRCPSSGTQRSRGAHPTVLCPHVGLGKLRQGGGAVVRAGPPVFALCYGTAPLGVPGHSPRVLAPWHSTARLGAPQHSSQSPSACSLAKHSTPGCPTAWLSALSTRPQWVQRPGVPPAQCHPCTQAGLQPPEAAPAGTAEAGQLVSQVRQGAGTPALAPRHCLRRWCWLTNYRLKNTQD